MALFHIRGVGCPCRTRHLLRNACIGIAILTAALIAFHRWESSISIYEVKRDSKFDSSSVEKSTVKIANKRELVTPSNQSNTSKESGEHKDPRFLQLESKFPWIVRRNFLVNYFTRRKNNSDGKDDYGRSKLVFLHHNKAAGTTVKTCLTSLASRNSLRLGPVLASNSRVGIHTSSSRKNRYENVRIFMGGYSFGLCDEFQSEAPCSYFTFLRHPYERVISSFEYCKRARSDQLCSVLNANEVTINEWAKHQGNFFYRQVLFKPEFCMKEFNPYVNLRVNSEAHDIKWNNNVMSISCWFREKLALQNITTESERDLLLDYILENMETWFSVIGIAEEYEVSMQLMESVYKLQFTSVCGGMKKNYNLYQQTNSTDQNVSKKVDSLKAQLMADPAVEKSLFYDMLIYEKATEIFEKQKQVYTQNESRNQNR